MLLEELGTSVINVVMIGVSVVCPPPKVFDVVELVVPVFPKLFKFVFTPLPEFDDEENAVVWLVVFVVLDPCPFIPFKLPLIDPVPPFMLMVPPVLKLLLNPVIPVVPFNNPLIPFPEENEAVDELKNEEELLDDPLPVLPFPNPLNTPSFNELII